MKKIFTFLFVASALTSFATQTNSIQADSLFGIITFGAKYQVQDTIKIYNADGSLWHWLNLDDKHREPANKNFVPYNYDADYFRLAMRVVSRKGNRYEIIANELTGLKKFVVVDQRAIIAFVTWQEYIMKQLIGYEPASNPLRKTINGEVTTVSDDYRAHAVSFKGDWVQLKFDDYKLKDVARGWVRWRKGNEIILYFSKTEKPYSTFPNCSLIFSNSSFIITTDFWISASFAFDPIVLISRPISCARNPNFLPFD